MGDPMLIKEVKSQFAYLFLLAYESKLRFEGGELINV